MVRVKWASGMDIATTTAAYAVTSRPICDSLRPRSFAMRVMSPNGRISLVTNMNAAKARMTSTDVARARGDVGGGAGGGRDGGSGAEGRDVGDGRGSATG